MPVKKKFATIEQLVAKPPRTREVGVNLPDGEATIVLRAIGSKAYDDLVAAHPPTREQKKEQSAWNPDTFPAALLTACSLEPKIDEESAKQIFQSEHWSRGEKMGLFYALVTLNTEGLDVPFNATD